MRQFLVSVISRLAEWPAAPPPRKFISAAVAVTPSPANPGGTVAGHGVDVPGDHRPPVEPAGASTREAWRLHGEVRVFPVWRRSWRYTAGTPHFPDCRRSQTTGGSSCAVTVRLRTRSGEMRNSATDIWILRVVVESLIDKVRHFRATGRPVPGPGPRVGDYRIHCPLATDHRDDIGSRGIAAVRSPVRPPSEHRPAGVTVIEARESLDVRASGLESAIRLDPCKARGGMYRYAAEQGDHARRRVLVIGKVRRRARFLAVQESPDRA